MLSSRKRKASLDAEEEEEGPESSKAPKLKTAVNIIHETESTKFNSDAKEKINSLLPDDYDVIIVTASTKPEENVEGNEAVYGCIRLPIVTIEDALIWIKKFEKKTFTSYRTQRNWKNDPKTGLFKKKFLCNFRKPNDLGGLYSCRACLIMTIKDAKEISTNPDYYLRDFPSQVIIQFSHNHKIDPEIYLKNLNPITELRVTFHLYFSNGHSPMTALILHRCDLHSSYGSEFYDVVSNTDICPTYNWCSSEYKKLSNVPKIEINEAVSHYNNKCLSECAVLLDDNEILALSSPLMKNIFQTGFAEDLITVRIFSSPKNLEKRQKIILFLCHTPIGTLPIGVILAYTDSSEKICKGINALVRLLEVNYCPTTIISDENPLISKCLKKCFSKSQIIFNEFRLLQWAWRMLRGVCMDDHEEFQMLYNLFEVTLNSERKEDFDTNFQGLLNYVERFPKLFNFVKYFKLRAESYVLYARPKIDISEDVLNYTDSGTSILQDIATKYGQYFNISQVFDFLTKNYVKHYERKLIKIVNGDLKGFFKTNFYTPISKIVDFTCEKVSDTEFLLTLKNSKKFFVNAQLDTCTCQVSIKAGSCVHQYIVEKNLGLMPECYTPLGQDMMEIFQSILNSKKTLTSDRNPNMRAPNEKDELLSVNSSDTLNTFDNINLAPSELLVSLSDTEEISSLEFSDFTESNDEEFFSDTGLYNKESGELEPEGKLEAEEKAPDNINKTENVIIYEFDGSDLKNVDKLAPLYTYTIENENQIEYYEEITGNETKEINADENQIEFYEEASENDDKKTVEIAEFLTNLPVTTNLSNTDQFVTEEAPAQDILTTQYKVMENGVLSLVTEPDEDTENLTEDSCKENNLVLVSPKDIFTIPKSSKVNVLSSFVIKAPQKSLDLDTVMSKTLRNVKQDIAQKIIKEKPEIQENQVETGKPVECLEEFIIEYVEDPEESPHILNALLEGKNFEEKLLEIPNHVKENVSRNKSLEEIEEINAETCSEKLKPSIISEQQNQIEKEKSSTEENNIEDSVMEYISEETDKLYPEELLEEDLKDIIDIDSDDLEEIASQKYEPKVPVEPEKPSPKLHYNFTSAKKIPFEKLPLEKRKLTDTKNVSLVKPIGKFSGAKKVLPVKPTLIKKVEKSHSDEEFKKAMAQLNHLARARNLTTSLLMNKNELNKQSSIGLQHYSNCEISCIELHSELESSKKRVEKKMKKNVTIQSGGNSDSEKEVFTKSKKTFTIPLEKLKNNAKTFRKGSKTPQTSLHNDILSKLSSSITIKRIIPPTKNSVTTNEEKSVKKAEKGSKIKDNILMSKPNSDLDQSLSSIINKTFTNKPSKKKSSIKKLDNDYQQSIRTVQNSHQQSSKKLDVKELENILMDDTVDKDPVQQSPKQLAMIRDAKKLENILMHGSDSDVDHNPEILKSSLLHNDELSFIFKDPRFETIVEEEEEDKKEDTIKKVEIKKKDNKENQRVIYLFSPKTGKFEIISRKNKPETKNQKVKTKDKLICKKPRRNKNVPLTTVRPKPKISSDVEAQPKTLCINLYRCDHLFKETNKKIKESKKIQKANKKRKSTSDAADKSKSKILTKSPKKEHTFKIKLKNFKETSTKKDVEIPPKRSPKLSSSIKKPTQTKPIKINWVAASPKNEILPSDSKKSIPVKRNRLKISPKKETLPQNFQTIETNIFDKTSTPLVTSTPIKNAIACYEDSFKRFLESKTPSNETSSESQLVIKKIIKSPIIRPSPDSDSDDSEIKASINTPKIRARTPKSRQKIILSKSLSASKSDLELIVLLERSIEIENMCQELRLWRSGRKRMGYRELLENATKKKFF